MVGLTLTSLALATVALVGCTRADSASGGGPGGGAQAQSGVAGDGAKTNAGGGTAAGGQGSPALAPQLRAIIYTGSMVVTVTDVVTSAEDAGAVAVAVGGNVAADHRTLDGDHSEAELVLRVPSDAFSSTLDRLAHLGTEQSRAVTTQDVTEDLIDLDARLATQRASVERVRALLAKATTVGEVVSIESELTKREADLDSLEQRRAKLSGLVALSTITLTLRGSAAPAAAQESHSGFVYGLRSGWSAFLVSARAFLTVAGWLAPWLIVIGIPGWLVLRYARRRRRAATGSATPSTGGADQG
jgi:hypothetical protein